MLAVVSLALCFAPRPALAQSTAAAEALFTEGHNAMAAKDYETACQRFHESNRLDPAVGTVLNLAVCETARNRLATAWELFRTVSEKLPADDPRRDYVTSQLAQIEPRLPKLTMRLAPGAPTDTRAMEGDVEFSGAAFGLRFRWIPANTPSRCKRAGFEPLNVDVDLAEGARQELEIAPGPARPSEPAPQNPQVRRCPTARPHSCVAEPLPAQEPSKRDRSSPGGMDRRRGWRRRRRRGHDDGHPRSRKEERRGRQLQRCSPGVHTNGQRRGVFRSRARRGEHRQLGPRRRRARRGRLPHPDEQSDVRCEYGARNGRLPRRSRHARDPALVSESRTLSPRTGRAEESVRRAASRQGARSARPSAQ